MKEQRHHKIVELISAEAIETQEELASRLREAGFPATQATISRDIRELKLQKRTLSDGRQCYTVFEQDTRSLDERLIRVLKDSLISMDAACNILVLKTVPGMAMAACAALDACRFEEIVGSIAGDDTIMCALHTNEAALIVKGKIQKMLEKIDQ